MKKTSLLKFVLAMTVLFCSCGSGSESSSSSDLNGNPDWMENFPFDFGFFDNPEIRLERARDLKEHYENVEMTTVNESYEEESLQEGTLLTDRQYDDTYVHWIEMNGNHLYMEITYPENFDESRQYTTVILAHGYQSCLATYIPFITEMQDQDYIFVAFDFRGMGNYTLSDGSLMEMTLDTMAADLKSVTMYVTSLPYVDKDSLFLVGHSLGGVAAAITMTSLGFENTFQGVAMLAPAFSVLTNYAREYTFENIPESALLLEDYVSGEFIASCLRHFDVYMESRYYQNRLLMILDTGDILVNNYDNRDYINMFMERGTLIELEGKDHFFISDDHRAAVENAIISMVEGR